MQITNVFKCTQHEFNKLKTRDLVPLECIKCKTIYYRMKRYIINHVRDHNRYPTTCSLNCKDTAKTILNCTYCNIQFEKQNSEIKRYKNHFCSKSCSTTYSNKNKTHGTRRSKLEKYLEEQLTILYPNLEILYSNKSIIGSELDIYIPSLKLAIEIQGIFHYEPIFGELKLNQIKKNDLEKKSKCKNLGIELICLDVSKQKKFTPKSSKIFLDYILDLIKVKADGQNRTDF